MKSAIARAWVLLVLIACAPVAMASVYDNVVYQAYRALDPSAGGYSSQMLNGDYVGDWDWLTSDNDYQYLAPSYGPPYCLASDWATSGDGSGCSPLGGWVSFYAYPSWYGYTSSASPLVNRYGRGGQCVYFVNLVLYRAGVHIAGLNIATMNNQSLPLSYAQPGYVLQRYNVSNTPTNHVAIIVGVTRDGSGAVTAVTVVDSNWVSDNGPDMEIIARHTITNLTGFRVWNNY